MCPSSRVCVVLLLLAEACSRSRPIPEQESQRTPLILADPAAASSVAVQDELRRLRLEVEQSLPVERPLRCFEDAGTAVRCI